MVELLAGVAMVAFGAVGLTTLVRTLVPSRWVESTKPWSCDLCMSWWSSIVCVVVAVFFEYGTIREAVVTLLPSFALAYSIQQRLHPIPDGGPPMGPPPPPLVDRDENEL
jgi:hypothetical protein